MRFPFRARWKKVATWALVILGIGWIGPQRPLAETLELPSAKLERLFQWGLHDSLLFAANQVIAAQAQVGKEKSVDDPRLAQPLMYRGVARYSLQDIEGALADFRAAVCLDSSLRLDSIYVPHPMLDQFNQLHQSVARGEVSCTLPALQNPNQSPLKSNALRSQERWRTAGFGFGAFSILAFGVTGYEAYQAQIAYRDAQHAAADQDAVRLAKADERYHESNQRKRLGLSLAVLSGVGTAFCFYRGFYRTSQPSRTETTQLTPLPSWVPQSIAVTSQAWQLSWTF